MKFFASLIIFAIAATTIAAADEFSADQLEFFEVKIRPLLAKHCYECHSGDSKKLKGELRLDSRARSIKGGESGAALVPGKPNESLLIQAVRWESFEMPPKGKLAEAEIALLEKWVKDGGPWPATDEKITETPISYDWKALQKDHWAFQTPQTPELPTVKNRQWLKNEIDNFVLAKLELNKLKPVPAAEPHKLIRRIYIDLIGLPPSPEQVSEFTAAYAGNPDEALTAVIDKLLASPQYGERWGRHWLDVARYSDGYGGFLDSAGLPDAWRYRDWVIQAFNDDIPYNEFVRLQIAGDLIDKKNGAVATGFFALGPTYKSDGGDPDSVSQAKSETLDDRVDTLTRGFMALTASCARCHDHKFDPIPQLDYYSLAGVFNNSRAVAARTSPESVNQAFDQHQQQLKELEAKVREFDATAKKEKRKLTAAEEAGKKQAQEKAEQHKKKSPPAPTNAHALADGGSADMKLAIRGNLRKPGEIAPRRFLRILAGKDPAIFDQGSGRLQLANAVADAHNPLTARVFVNRVWMHHFGAALTRTPSNFGALGEKPTHPKLLDWLAVNFIESGWSIKQLHRQIMLSATYRLSSQFDDANYNADGDNRFIWRMNPRRLDAESWRDSLLSATGELQLATGGPPVDDINSLRRTMYFKVSRSGDQFRSDDFLRLFDFPIMRATVAKRPTSIVPQQFLFLMNSSFMVARARALTARLEREAQTDQDKITRAYQLLYGRAPSAEEIQIGLGFLNGRQTSRKTEPGERLPSDAATKPVGGQDLVIADFEGPDYGEWKVTGEAFGPGPAQGTLDGQMAVSGFLGKGLVNTFFGGDGTKGTLTSPPIKIERKFINFLVGGGKYPGETCINLLVDNQVARTATGPNNRGGGSEKLAWQQWDVADLLGKTVSIQIVDNRSGGWGHINVDQIYQSNSAPSGVVSAELAQKPPGKKPALDRWIQYTQVLLSSNEFMYVQ